MFDPETKYQIKPYIGKVLAYNDTHRIIRIEFDKRQFDFEYVGGYQVPNPAKHIALIMTSEENLTDTRAITEYRQNLPPGWKDEIGNLVDLPMGYVDVIPKKQMVSKTNPNSGGAGFALSKTNMFDLEKVAVAISPPLNKDYTNTEKDNKNLDDGVGIFINNDGVILIKSKGSSITMAEEGTYISGPVSWESSEHQREFLMDNTFQRFIPSTIVTFPVSFPELPNVAKFAQIADGARKVRSVIESVSKITTLIG